MKRHFLFQFDYRELIRRRGIVLRSICYALLLSHDIRRDVHVWISVRDECGRGGILELRGDTLRHLRPDEATSWGILRKGLTKLRRLKDGISKRAHHGLLVYKMDVGGAIALMRPSKCLIIERRGDLSPKLKSLKGGSLLIVLNMDESAFTYGEINEITRKVKDVVRLGMGNYDLTLDQTVAVINWLLDEYCGT
ncbi:MAG: hypothetical protein J7L11_00405 [Thermoprotei archaeon]|nr:hypothetical protein [Thermoprotei archaeon]